MNSDGPRLALGTAQWGAPYGITNVRGELSDEDVSDVVEVALNAGIADVDTHRTKNLLQGYGRAQSRLKPWANKFTVTTKVFAGTSADESVVDQLAGSLDELGVERVHACLVHDWSQLTATEAEAAVFSLKVAQKMGIVGRLGISAYDTRDLERAIELFGSSLGSVQIPCSVLDQRVCGTGALETLRSMGTEIQVRSIFLQGLLLESNSQTVQAQSSSVLRFHKFCADCGVSPLEMCLSFIRSLDWANKVVFGVTSARELLEIVAAWSSDPVAVDWVALAAHEPELLDPRKWRPSSYQ